MAPPVAGSPRRVERGGPNGAPAIAEQQQRNRRRGTALEEPILEAVWAELAEIGWRDFQINRVAERSGASKASIYRRWRDRADLVLAALIYKSQNAPSPTALSGDLRGDLVTFLTFQADALTQGLGEAVRGVVAEVVARGRTGDDGLQPPPVELIFELLEASGEVSRPRELPVRVVNLGVNMVSQQYLNTGVSPDAADIVEIVDLVWIPAIRAASG